MSDKVVEPWALSTARRWWCKDCRQFTYWEFRGEADDDGRCGEHVKLCPSGCGCAPGQADMRDCACDGPCVFDEAWRASDV